MTVLHCHLLSPFLEVLGVNENERLFGGLHHLARFLFVLEVAR